MPLSPAEVTGLKWHWSHKLSSSYAPHSYHHLSVLHLLWLPLQMHWFHWLFCSLITIVPCTYQPHYFPPPTLPPSSCNLSASWSVLQSALCRSILAPIATGESVLSVRFEVANLPLFKFKYVFWIIRTGIITLLSPLTWEDHGLSSRF